MSVIVKGMEMPNSCASCRMAVCFADTGRAKCYATLSYIDPERGKRSYDCPLLPLPEKHGRLIEADSLKETLDYYIREADWGEAANCVLGWVKDEFIDSEQTIVEAEG